MSNFDDDLMKGFTQYDSHFQKWCEKASPILGKVTQCGIFENDITGHGFLATNRPDYGELYINERAYLIDPFYSYITNIEQSKLSINPFNSEIEQEGYFDLNGQCPYLNVSYVIAYKERVDQKTIRTYGFASDNPRVHDALVNNLSVFKKFLYYFKSENEDAIKFIKDNKVNFSSVKDDFFVKNDFIELTDREKTNAFLRTAGVMDRDQAISKREWQCVTLYSRGKSASDTAKILNISRRTVEAHFDSVKQKLHLPNKSDILETIN